jgi:hypothetical protein
MRKKDVQYLFDFTLNEIQKDLGQGITSDEQINEYCTFLPNFLGAFAWDQIPKLKNMESCIINLDKSNQPGSHWVALFKFKKKIYIFDSFDRKISNFKRVDIDKIVTQGKKELNCGQRSISFLVLVETLGLNNTLKL